MANPPIKAQAPPTKPARHPWVEKNPADIPDTSRTALREAMRLERTQPAEFDDCSGSWRRNPRGRST